MSFKKEPWKNRRICRFFESLFFSPAYNNCRIIKKITQQFFDEVENFIQECVYQDSPGDIFIISRQLRPKQSYLLFQIVLNPRQLRNYRYTCDNIVSLIIIDSFRSLKLPLFSLSLSVPCIAPVDIFFYFFLRLP